MFEITDAKSFGLTIEQQKELLDLVNGTGGRYTNIDDFIAEIKVSMNVVGKILLEDPRFMIACLVYGRLAWQFSNSNFIKISALLADAIDPIVHAEMRKNKQ